MAGFNIKDYEPVEERLHRAHEAQGDLRIVTEIVAREDKTVIVKASVFKSGDDLERDCPWATGYAQETIGGQGITRDSWLEVCETSAIGRALANAGFSPKGNRPSREEMSKAQRSRPVQVSEAPAPAGPPSDPLIAEVVAQVKQLDAGTRDRFKAEFGAKPSEIKNPRAALAWLSAETEPF